MPRFFGQADGIIFKQAVRLELCGVALSAALDEARANMEETGQKNNTHGVRYSIERTTAGEKVVLVEGNILDGVKKPYEPHVANYIKKHVNEVYRVIESGSKIYLGKDLPGEYTYSASAKNLNRSVKKAKYMAAIHIGEMIEISKNRSWKENTKSKHKKDAKYGFYKYDTKFAIPVYDAKKNMVSSKIFDAVILIRNDENGKKYLYDLLNVKQDKSSQLSHSWKTKIDNVWSTYPATANIPQVIDDVKFRGKNPRMIRFMII